MSRALPGGRLCAPRLQILRVLRALRVQVLYCVASGLALSSGALAGGCARQGAGEGARPARRPPPARLSAAPARPGAKGARPRANSFARAKSRSRAASNTSVTVMLGGDVMLARGVARRAHPARRANETGSRASVTGQAGWSALLAGVAPVLRRADLAIANLESPLVSAGQCLPGGTVARPRLCGDPRGVAALRAAGVDAVTLANNHALDAGLSGLRHTARRLQKAGIVPLGLEAARRGTPRAERLGPLTVVAVSLTVAAHPPGVRVPLPSPAALAAAIRRARRQAPARPVLVLAHLGREGDPLPGPRERAYGRAAVGAGAAAVVLHGAHVRRALVRDRGVPVHLGLGNLLFYQRAPKHRVGELLGLAFPRPSASATSPGVRVVARRCVDSRRAVLIPCP